MEILRLASLTYLGSLSMRELSAIAPYAQEVSLPAGRRVLLDGGFAQELVLVATGRGSVRSAGETVAALGPGDVFGTLAPRRTTYPSATVTALSPLRLVAFSTRDLRELDRLAPDVLQALLAACAQEPVLRAKTPPVAAAIVRSAAAAA
ncbi:MAG TPA: cyclic nucleotide-binding domain-containing protein [Solirubrobacteraceae bacterium]|nr:cyclic nucleotide-binding domain-containing protein [Solirubrobacteraceae bacterium]